MNKKWLWQVKEIIDSGNHTVNASLNIQLIIII